MSQLSLVLSIKCLVLSQKSSVLNYNKPNKPILFCTELQ